VLPAQVGVNQRLLIVGADGLLGGALRRHWRQRGCEVAATSFLNLADSEGVQHLDLAQPQETWPALPPCRAAVLCAAITSLEQCRRDPAATRHINVTQTLALAQRLVGQGCFVVFISSNLVFDGSKPCRNPAEPACPQTEYGRQKAEAEAGLTGLGERAAIVRLTKVFHSEMPLVCGWMKSLREGKAVQPFTDLICSPITFHATIQTIAAVTERQASGLWQLSGSADISYAGIAAHVARRAKCDPALVQPATSRGVVSLEHLPAHSTLDATQSQTELGFEILDPLTVIDRTFFHETQPA
jgi:dTDP-4-dehydrorhamnose reductase